MKRILVLFVALLFLAYFAALGFDLHTRLLCSDTDITDQWLGERVEMISSNATPNTGKQWLFKADEAALRDILRTLHANPTETGTVYQPALPIILTDEKAVKVLGYDAYDVRIECFQGGHVQMDWIPHDENAFEYIPVYLPTQPNELLDKLGLFSAIEMILGPAIPLNAALLLLMPFGSRQRLLRYLLPLVHAGILACMGFLYGLKAGEPFACVIAPVFALFWCPVSLLQSLLFGGIVRLCRVISEKRRTHLTAC